ncbi:ATP-binding protein [Desulfococcaceae bacterium HSG7]|nr:ATP-binding protein [Desulfococcaceae bacterium HSG7]
MKIYPKILISILPLIVLSILVSVGAIYYLAYNALNNLSEKWLSTKLADAIRTVCENEAVLRKYGLENVTANVSKAKIHTYESLKKIKIGKGGYVWVVSDKGIIVAHPDSSITGMDISHHELFKKMLSDSKGQCSYTWKEENRMAVYEKFLPWQWYILASAPRSEVYGEVHQIKYYVTVIGFFSVFVTALVLMFLTRILTAPLHVLVEETKRIGAGDLNVSVKVAWKDEFGTLAIAFNSMAKKLKTTMNGLEQRFAELRTAKKALQKNEERLRAIFEANPDPVVVYNQHGHAQYINPAFTQLFGWTLDEIANQKVPFVPKDQLKVTDKSINKLIETGEPVSLDSKRLTKDGKLIDVLIKAASIKTLKGNPEKMVVNLTDMTENKRLERQLQRAQKMEAIGTLAGGVAHDLNNILSAQVSYPGLILMKLPKDSSLRNPLLTIQKSGQKAAAIVEDLLTLARRGVAVADVVNMNLIIDSYLQSPEFDRLKAFHPYIKIECDLETHLFNIAGSSVHLSKTVMNLVSNAAEAMPTGGTVFISTQNKYIDLPVKGYDNIKEGDYVIFTVRDTGIGIAPEDLEKIFEPFYTKKVMGRSGTGLGMAVVWGTVKDHKGYINVQSTERRGTTFTLYFPATRKAMNGKAKIAPVKEYMGEGNSILVVDDVQDQREIVSLMLENLGYSVTSVSSGEKAVDYMKNNSADLLVLDMIMEPGIDGLETYKRIIAIHPGQKAIISSGFSETERVKEAQRLGAGEYIKKPYVIEKLGLTVKKELKKTGKV